MIIENIESTVTPVVGEILESKVTIKQEDVDFILQMLSQNFYSRPIESAIREIVSNALDATKEAGSKERVIIKVEYVDVQAPSKGLKISIIDNGNGISEETFNNYYLNMGASTKRSDNNSIGGFGFGRFAPLAVSDTVEITTFCNGYRYFYTMYKDALSIKFALIEKVETGVKKTGTIVSFAIRNGYVYTIENTIQKTLMCFNNIKVDSHIVGEYNIFEHDLKIIDNIIQEKRSINRSYYENEKISVAGAIYESKQFEEINSYLDYGLIPYFQIGELDINPNRESVLETDKTLKAIENKKEAILKYYVDYYKLGENYLKDVILANYFSHLKNVIKEKGFYKNKFKTYKNTIYLNLENDLANLCKYDTYVKHGETLRKVTSLGKIHDVFTKLLYINNFKLNTENLEVSAKNFICIYDKNSISPIEKQYLSKLNEKYAFYISKEDYASFCNAISNTEEKELFNIVLSVITEEVNIPELKKEKEIINYNNYHQLYLKRTDEIGFTRNVLSTEEVKTKNTFYVDSKNINNFVVNMIFLTKGSKFFKHNLFILKNKNCKILENMNDILTVNDSTKGIYRHIQKMASVIYLFEKNFKDLENQPNLQGKLGALLSLGVLHPEIEKVVRKIKSLHFEKIILPENLKQDCIKYIEENGLHPEIELFIFNSKRYMSIIQQFINVSLYFSDGMNRQYYSTTEREAKKEEIRNFLNTFYKLKYENIKN